MESIATYQERVKRWTAALRSGEYRQGQYHLCDLDHFYCCLGVACEVAIQGGVNLTKTLSTEGSPVQCYQYVSDTDYRYYTGILPKVVMVYFGISNALGAVSDPVKGFLAHLNDHANWSFDQIADYIDTYPAGLFTWSNEEVISDDSSHQ